MFMKKEKQSSTQRTPFQDLNNGFSRNNSSISSSVSIDAPKGCLRFFLSNPTSSKTPLLHKPISLSKTKSKIRTKTTPKSAPNAKRSSSLLSSSARSNTPSNENRLPKPKPSKKKKNLPCLYQWQSGSKTQQPISPGSVPRSKFLTNLDNIVGNSPSGPKEFGQKLKDLKWELKKLDNVGESSEHLNTHVVENCTPVGKLACGSVLDCENYDRSNNLVEQGSNSATKTPPVQASVSPEILCGTSVLDTTSTKTPNTCYAAGHVISGVTDKRKCRPRGILTVGAGLDSSGCNMKGNVTDSDDSSGHYIRVLRNSRSSLIPLPAEASMSWHLSPCHEDGGEKGDSANRLRSSATTDLPSSPILSDGSASYLRNKDTYSGTTNSNATPSGSKTRITLLSPKRLSKFHGFSGYSSDKVGGQLSVVSPFATPSCKAVLSQEERKSGYNLAGENSPFSIGSLSSGNVMQTPKSESSSERHVYPSWLDSEGSPKEHHETEIDSLVEVLQSQSLSPKSHVSLWDPLGLSFQFADLSPPSDSIDLNQIENILHNHDSWISDSTLENVPQSKRRISWREGLASRIFEMDELDCCKCLSDEENDAEGSSKDQLKAHHEFNVDVQIDKFSDDGFGSPEFLDHEPRIGVKGKAKSSPQRPNSCAESIGTDGGGLVASGDSDWTLCYKNHLFEI